jgi:hypothetical protein
MRAVLITAALVAFAAFLAAPVIRGAVRNWGLAGRLIAEARADEAARKARTEGET